MLVFLYKCMEHKTWKEEYIAIHGEGSYTKRLERDRKWNETHPEKVKQRNMEICRKGGKYYDKNLAYQHTGLQGERGKVRMKHYSKYRKFKSIIAPLSQIHHEWIPETADYRGVALVEADQHMHGFIDVISILDGEITLRSEAEVRKEEV